MKVFQYDLTLRKSDLFRRFFYDEKGASLLRINNCNKNEEGLIYIQFKESGVGSTPGAG